MRRLLFYPLLTKKNHMLFHTFMPEKSDFGLYRRKSGSKHITYNSFTYTCNTFVTNIREQKQSDGKNSVENCGHPVDKPEM